MNRIISTILYSGALVYGLAPNTALAANTHFASGDLILFFQKEGSSNTVYADIGNAATLFRGAAAGPDAANKVNFADISATLTSAFGAGWASDPTIYAGVAGVWGVSQTSNTLQNGDPQRTLYVSSARGSVGTVGAADSVQWGGYGNTAMTDAATGILAMNNVFANNYDASSTVSPTSVSLIDDYNPFLSTDIQGAGFSTFDGGVQQQGSASSFGTYGAAGSVEFALDLYRILAKNTIPGQVGGDLRTGSYEGTITVNSSGQVSFIAQGASLSAYDSWMANFTSITASADKLDSADPDKDGATNLEEFGFGGDPSKGGDQGPHIMQTVDANGDSQKDLTLTLAVRTGVTFSVAGNELVSSSVDGIVYHIQGSMDLASWNSAVSEVTPAIGSGSPRAGYVFKTFRLNGSSGLAGKGFIRAAVIK